MERSHEKEWHYMAVNEVFSSLKTCREGLTKEEAEERLAQYKENKIDTAKKKTPLFLRKHLF